MIFSAGHIALTAGLTALIAAAGALWALSRRAWPDVLAVAALSGAAVLLWRLSANLPALNNDGLPGFSANDWAAPMLAFVLLGVYADLRVPAQPRDFGRARAVATLAALAVNVITI